MESVSLASKSRARGGTPAPTHLILVLVVALCAGSLILDLNLPLGFAGGIPYVFVVGVAWYSRSTMLVLGSAIGSTLLILIGYLYSPPAVSPAWIVFLNRFFALAVLFLLASLFLRSIATEAERDRALLERERAWSAFRNLSGLIPICAGCKKIRDVEGSWEPLESYISSHSEAEFSHGLCADCDRSLYPEPPD
jgi:hypothetical protein